MNFQKLCTGKSKYALIGVLATSVFLILLPHAIKSLSFHFAPFTDHEVVIDTVYYEAIDRTDGSKYHVVGSLFQPGPKFSNDTYPGVIACHGFLFGLGKESMNRWCVELAKRGFVVLSIDLPANGMTCGKNQMAPDAAIQPYVIEDGLTYLKTLDRIDDSKMGLMGISYGGGMVALSSGVLGDKVQATVCFNGYTNMTHWLINGILPDFGFDFTVTDDEIILNSVGGNPVTENSVREAFLIYSLLYGDVGTIDYVMSTTTPNAINRTVLKRFDAVEYLGASSSILFIRATKDGTFHNTGQALMGKKAAGSNGIYLEVNDDHQLFSDPTFASDYAYINYFEQELKGVNLEGGPTVKYFNPRDIVLTYPGTFGFVLAYEALGVFFLSIIPILAIVNIMFYEKRHSEQRAIKLQKVKEIKEKGETFHGIPFSMGSYKHSITYMCILIGVTYTAVIGLSLGFFTFLIAYIMLVLFYGVFNLLIYFVPDKKEVEFWEEERNKESSKVKDQAKTSIEDRKQLVESLKKIGIIIVFVVVSSIAISIFSVSPQVFNMSAELLITPILISGITLIVGSLLLIFYFEKRENENVKFKAINWEKYKLSKYQLVSSAAFGVAMAMVIIFQYTIISYVLKFPMMFGPHSLYYIYVAIAVVLFAIGLEIINEGILNKLLLDEKDRSTMIKSKILVIILGTIINFLVGTLLFYPFLGLNSLGNFAFYVGLAFAAIYLITRVLNLFAIERGILNSAIFYPLFFLFILGFFMRM